MAHPSDIQGVSQGLPTGGPEALPAVIPGLLDLWSVTTGDPHVCVAVLDGPVDLQHPCFDGAQLTVVESLIPNIAGDDVASRHGTHVASIIFGQHGSTVTGIAPRCHGLIVPIYSPGAGDILACTQLDLARAINQAIVHGANIINVSGGRLDPGGEAEPLLADAIRRCTENGILVVAAAGNDGCACLHVPAAVPSVLAVGAMSADAAVLEFSNWGETYRKQGVLAFGENIAGAVPGGGIASRTGTSFAAGMVSGVAALLMSAQLQRGERPDASAVREAILDTADPCDCEVDDCSRVLAGRVRIGSALARIAGAANAAVTASGHDERQVSLRSDNAGGAERLELNNQRRKEGETMSEQALAIDCATSPVLTGAGDGPVAEANVRAAEYHPPQVASPPGTAGDIHASECAPCAAGAAKGGALVYALGQLGYDFGSEARRDQFVQLTRRNVHDPAEILAHLEHDPASAASIIWTLSLDSTVVYAIVPCGPFAMVAYERLREALRAQLNEGADRLSVPGFTTGTVRLLNGQVMPVICPDVRGLYSWSTPKLVQAAIGQAPKGEKAITEFSLKTEGIRNFLERVYYEVRNLGTTPQERAMNYAATNAFQIEHVYRNAVTSGLKLDSIDVERSPICRPESDCWDVKLIFFDPSHRLDRARHVYRFTVDVSDVIPVTVGPVRDWDVY